MMSSTMNSDVLKRLNDADNASDEENNGGRPSNEEQGEAVSEKTIQNKESGINENRNS